MARVRPGDDPLRVGVVGYGLGGSAFHAPFVATTPGLELSAIVTRDPERQRKAARDYPGVRVVAEVERLWDRTVELDVVVISTPNRTHVPLALSAIAAGLHVVVDKPLAPSVTEARDVVSAAQRRGVVLGVFQNRRWDGDFQTIRRLLADGALGVPFRFESRFERWRPVPTGGWRERGTPEDAGGLLFDLGSHLIDQALVLFGPATDVYAELDQRRAGVDADDDAFVAITHASGVRSQLHMSAVAGQAGARFRLLGSKAAYVKWGLDVQEAALREGMRPGGAEWGVEPSDQWGTLGTEGEGQRIPTERGDYGAFYAGLVRAIRSDAPPPVDPSDVIAALEVIEAARASAQQHTVVRR
jgi:predicted dehydrogenase